MIELRDANPDEDEDAMARILVDAFARDWPAEWPDLASGREEVREVCAQGFARVAVVDGELVGWIGALRQYRGRVYELHPLAVAPARQGRGIGRALVGDLEAQVRARGGLTILLGTDDAQDTTSLFGVDLYDDVPRHLATLAPKRRHPFTFYRALGYTVCGCVPDANGIGKPNIQMAKRVTSR